MMGWKKRKKKQKELTKKYARQRRELLVFTLRSSQSVFKDLGSETFEEDEKGSGSGDDRER